MGDATTIPCTLFEAVTVCSSKSETTRQDSPLDIMGVVVNFSYTRDPFPIACLWLEDASVVPSGTKALFSLRGATVLARLQEADISVGDVLRFNRVSLKEVESPRTQSSETVFHFHHSWTEPEAGPQWYRLYHAGGGDSNYPLQNTLDVPVSMRTDSACLESLVSWYRQSKHFQSRTTETTLSTLSCQQRSLLAIQALVGVPSNVVVRVMELQKATPKPAPSRKRRRSSDTKKPCTFALLSDGASSITLVDDENRLYSVLKQALASKRPLRLTRVLSETSRSLAGMRKDVQDEVVLVPTRNTIATLLNENEASMPKASVAGTQSQMHLSAATLDSNARRKVVVVISPLLDMFLVESKCSLSQVSEDNDDDACAKKWVSTALVKPETLCFYDAIITLETAVLPGNPRVHANASIVQQLCGDLPPADFLSEQQQSLGRHNYAFKLLFSMWKEQVPLRWTLEPLPVPSDTTVNYRVVNVALPSLAVSIPTP